MNASRQAGFTMVELITVMILIGVLAAIGVPKLMGDNDTGAIVFGDQAVSILRTAQKTAVARRRTVRVEATATSLTARICTSPDKCELRLDGATASGKVTLAGAPARLFFQPDGTIATDPAGTPAALVEIGIQHGSTLLRSIRVEGSTGFVASEQVKKE